MRHHLIAGLTAILLSGCAKSPESILTLSPYTEQGPIRKSLDAGIHDMNRSTLVDSVETAWAYSFHEKEWTPIVAKRIPMQESLGTVTISIEYDTTAISNLIAKYDSLCIFHTHPAYAVDQVLGSTDTSSLGDTVTIADLRKQALFSLAIPTHSLNNPEGDDFSVIFTQAKEFYEIHPKGLFIQGVISPYGVTMVRFSDLGIQKMLIKAPLSLALVTHSDLANGIVNGLTYGSRMIRSCSTEDYDMYFNALIDTLEFKYYLTLQIGD